MTVEHLIEVLKKFDGKEKVFIKVCEFNNFDYVEVDASMGVDIVTEKEKGVIIDLTDCSY